MKFKTRQPDSPTAPQRSGILPETTTILIMIIMVRIIMMIIITLVIIIVIMIINLEKFVLC